ncbi:hypothetical protein [Bacillus cihuensis]|uniref:hypothetical protein n=1 Tax=Bacillus cihuensis TaxID=1208599 RepID=UPI0004042B49|nr:hypothetical protein [Bacillus cihuensis]
MFEQDERLISESIDRLESNELLIVSQKEEYIKLLELQEQKFLERAEKVKPIISYLKKHHYSFYNKKFDCRSYKGPIIGRNENEVYIYEGEWSLVTSKNLQTGKKDSMMIKTFLDENSFKDAMDALLETAFLQENELTIDQKKIENANKDLNSVFG